MEEKIILSDTIKNRNNEKVDLILSQIYVDDIPVFILNVTTGKIFECYNEYLAKKLYQTYLILIEMGE